ncbi:LysR family transcriptional regulator [Arthrobacter crystallopoietes BAB-32]|uniref:LysR family transcriptional regulator n=1 Tax=Arthrobacter crystallopoietes BAB-32 TaxID=1246476 RepID=N1V459_9MICC|nr:LysR substrate-binding domain-containing protein [Arthrobacter crystallopoietes]EMY36140.1 LysR family transcriptional regulator [Arthrobacter crystallopoietes BAB-32]
MKEITLRQLEYFAAVAETQSVTEAARRCSVSQAAVSLALAQLEEAVGATLAIRRRGKGIALTAEGQAVATRARQVAEQIEGLASAVGQVHGELSGRLVIGVFRTLSMHAIPPLIDWFMRKHPQVQLDFLEGPGPEIQEAMLAGRAQLCVVYEAQLLPDCTGEVLRETKRQAVFSPEHPLAAQAKVSLAELARYPAMLMDEEPALQRTVAEFARAGVEPEVRWRSRSVQAIHNVVGRNLAYSLLMQPAAHSPEGRPLVFRPIDGDVPANSVMAALPSGVARSALVTEALSALRHYWGTNNDGAASP